jgi:chromosome partitioning protein
MKSLGWVTKLLFSTSIPKAPSTSFDLDPQGSINVACRLNKTPAPKSTTAWIYSGFFDGTYSLTPVWQQHTKNLEVFQGGSALFKVMPNLSQSGGGDLLKEALLTYPLDHDLIIFDCPATLESIPKSALIAATHLLVPLIPDASFGAAARSTE